MDTVIIREKQTEMNPTELRIGNYVSRDGEVDVINGIWCEIGESGLDDFYIQAGNKLDYPIDDIQPIPITEEWLKRIGFALRFDFDKSHGIYYNKLREDTEDMLTLRPYYMGGFLWGHSENPDEFPIEMGNPIGVEHVHQLQNLYFALTGSDLKIQ